MPRGGNGQGGYKEGAGRPPKEFDKRLFENLCHVQCTNDEIEAILNTDQRVLDGWCHRTYDCDFATAYQRYSKGGKASLRRNQYKMSATNASMAIWLGKVQLGQRDMQEVDDRINKALGILDAAKRLRVVDEHANTISEAVIEPTGVNGKV